MFIGVDVSVVESGDLEAMGFLGWDNEYCRWSRSTLPLLLSVVTVDAVGAA